MSFEASRDEVSSTATDAVSPLRAPPDSGAATGWALFVDVDGTLLDFAGHPDEVEVGPDLRADLARLRERLAGALALLSGRSLAQLDGLFGRDFAAAGLHGAQLRSADGRECVVGDVAAFAGVRARAANAVANASGVVLEDKQLALALHFRRAPGAHEVAERIAAELLRAAGNSHVLQRGDHVIELKPAGVDKGRALDALMRDPPFHGRTPWMLGDDLTDEDAFARVNARAGISVIVGARRPTAARHALRDPVAVRAWLHALVRCT